MSSERRYFGTDGIRGRVGTYPITPDFVLKLGWAIGRVFFRAGGSVLIGKDTRISGYMFESALEAGITSAGVDVRLLGPMPTPAIAYLTRTFQARAGIVISASHNSYEDNGFKFFSSAGTKLADEIELAIEQMLDRPMETADSAHIGKASRISDASGRYIEFCKSTLHGDLRLNGVKIVLDCANGATYQVAPSVFRELGATVTTIATQPDGFNINEDCGSTHPEQLAREVISQKADLGIAFDGDGDRVVMVDHTGSIVDGDELLYIIALSELKGNTDNQGVIGTEMSNLGLQLGLEAAGIPFRRSKVGDRYVMQELEAQNWRYGGESSGHIICLDSTTTGDAIVAALQVLKAMDKVGASLHELKSGMNKLPQAMVNVRLQDRVTQQDHDRLKNSAVIATAIKDVETSLGQNGRVLLRPSGTEPVVRVMIEGADEATVRRLLKQLAATVAQELSAS